MTPKRRLCSQCHLAINNCICQHAIAVNNPVELLVLQHPQEANEVKNTIRLLSLCAKNIQIKIGEAFSDTELYQLIYADQKIPLLLYPPTPEGESLGIQIAPELPDLSNLPIEQIRLVILDATWKKSRKMLYLNNELQKLPRLALVQIPPSIYAIRKVHNKNQLSSLEACCYAWRQLEQTPEAYSHLLKAFEGFVNQQRRFIENSAV
jgi:DTW domain-containing protein YfiP